MRHSFASLLLQRGESPAYLQEQLGHASIELTVGTYGRWLRKRPTIGSEALDRPISEASGSKTAEVVAGSAAGGEDDGSPDPSSALYLKVGGEGGIRTPGTGFNPVQQISNLPYSAALAPLRERLTGSLAGRGDQMATTGSSAGRIARYDALFVGPARYGVG